MLFMRNHSDALVEQPINLKLMCLVEVRNWIKRDGEDVSQQCWKEPMPKEQKKIKSNNFCSVNEHSEHMIGITVARASARQNPIPMAKER